MYCVLKYKKMRWEIKKYINEYQQRSTSVYVEFNFEEKQIEIQTDLAQEPEESFRAYGYSGAGTYTSSYTIERFITGGVLEGFRKKEKEEESYWREALNPSIKNIFKNVFLGAFAEYISGNYQAAFDLLERATKNGENKDKRTFTEECIPFFKQKLSTV